MKLINFNVQSLYLPIVECNSYLPKFLGVLFDITDLRVIEKMVDAVKSLNEIKTSGSPAEMELWAKIGEWINELK